MFSCVSPCTAAAEGDAASADFIVSLHGNYTNYSASLFFYVSALFSQIPCHPQ